MHGGISRFCPHFPPLVGIAGYCGGIGGYWSQVLMFWYLFPLGFPVSSVPLGLLFLLVLVGIGQGIGGYCWELRGYRWVLVPSFQVLASFSFGFLQKNV